MYTFQEQGYFSVQLKYSLKHLIAFEYFSMICFYTFLLQMLTQILKLVGGITQLSEKSLITHISNFANKHGMLRCEKWLNDGFREEMG